MLLQECGGRRGRGVLGGETVSRESLANEPKHVFEVSVVLLKNQVIRAG